MKWLATTVSVFLVVSIGGCGASAPVGSSVTLTGLPAPVEFSCPLPGVITQTIIEDGTINKTVWQGEQTGDSVLCKALFNGVPTLYLFGIYQLPLSSGEEGARRVIGHAMAGSTTMECFEAKRAIASGAGYFYGEVCWKQLGPTSITLNGNTISVMALGYTYDGLAGNAYAGDWILYYDPVVKFFVKAETINRRGLYGFGWTQMMLS